MQLLKLLTSVGVGLKVLLGLVNSWFTPLPPKEGTKAKEELVQDPIKIAGVEEELTKLKNKEQT